MNIKSLFQQIGSATRSKDWRLSFVPFIIACVYLWSSLFALEFSGKHIILFLLSLCTTFGFAAFGYFVNEFFDKEEDLKAGKLNKLSLLSLPTQLLLFLVISMVCFLPWFFLPKNTTTYWLISAEIASFLLYSLPYLRLKKSVFFAGVLDAFYAYLIPGLLSYHTYSLVSSTSSSYFPILFFLCLFFIGYRNILIHQIKDVLGDQKAKVKTLPQYIGVKQSYNLLKILFVLEMTLLLAFSLSLAWHNNIYLLWLLAVISYLIYMHKTIAVVFDKTQYSALLPARHVLELLYQLWFPLVQLLILILIDWRWILILPFHLLLLVNPDYLFTFWGLGKKHLWHQGLRPLLSMLINYPLYLFFRLFGVDLKKDKKSASDYFKNKKN